MVPPRSVLIVDRSSDSRQVLRAALERRGLTILEADRADEGLTLARRHKPNLIVLDLEVDAGSFDSLPAEYEQATRAEHTPLVLLGNVRRTTGDVCQFVSKPYHYAPLVRKIEELVAQTGGAMPCTAVAR